MLTRRQIKKGEPLAILPEAVHSERGAAWWDCLSSVPDNERCGTITVVHVRGSLDHHPSVGCDSYDAIVDRVKSAMVGDDNDLPPRAIVLRIDSPGGAVSGLNETVFALRRLAKEHTIPLIAYVDELAASAAYAIACGCQEIYLPPSAIAGSIGVISTMCDVTEADEKAGVKFVTLTSGARKADGHPHVPISEAALSAEQRRVDRLAVQFFDVVAGARSMSADDVAGFQAGLFLGKEAVKAGLADDVMCWNDLLATLNDKKFIDGSDITRSPSKTPKVIPLRVDPRKGPAGQKEGNAMSMVALQALVKRTKASLESEKDPKKKKTITANLSTYQAALATYKKEKVTKETEESDETPAEGDEEEKAADEKSEDAPEKDEKKSAAAEDDDDEEEDDDEEASSEKAAAALAALASQVTGKKGAAAVGALQAMLAQGQRAAAQVDAIVKERRAEKKATVIGAALNARKITKREAETLRGKPFSFVESFLEMRPKAIVNIDDDSIRIPDPAAKADALSADIMAQINMAVSSAPDGVDLVALRQSMVDAHQKRMIAGLNGVGRY